MLDNIPTAKTAAQAVKENPYTAKMSNCTDATDCQNALLYLFACERKYGQSKALDAKIFALIDRKRRFLKR